jgi:hypothetical protein
MREPVYENQIEYINKLNNSRKSNDSHSFGVQTWFGINKTLANTKLSDRYQSDLVNVLPDTTNVQKSPGAIATGFHRLTNILEGKECLTGGYAEIRRSGSYLWKIVWDEKKNWANFYYCESANSDGGINSIWKPANPLFNENEYRFKGINYDSTVMQDRLYVCSGEEDFEDKNGVTGLLEFDFVTKTWTGIPTGKAAKVYIADANKDIIAARKDPKLYENDLFNFNPSIICEHNGQIFITGDKSNPYQFKVSEMYNPKNFTVGTLGSPTNGLNVEDNNRAYTFFVPQEITSATSFGDKILVGTKEKFYTYSRTNTGAPVDMDRIDGDITGNSGVANYKTAKVYKGANLMYVSDYQVVPELSVKSGQYSNSASRVYFAISPGTPVSQNVEEIFLESDVSNSTIGFYKNYIFTAISKCRNRKEYLVRGEKQLQTKNDTVLVYKRDGEYVMWSRIDYIKANYFFEAGNRGIYYCSSEDGNIYRLDETTNFIDNKSTYEPNSAEAYADNPQQFKSIIQTQITGVDTLGDNAFSFKKLDSLWIKGGFSSDTILDVKIFGMSDDCDSCQDKPIFEGTFSIINKEENTCAEQCDGQICVPLQNLNYYKGMKAFKKKILFGKDVSYTELFITITIENSFNFYITDVIGIYSVNKQQANGLILNPKNGEYVDYPVANLSGQEITYTCQICNN